MPKKNTTKKNLKIRLQRFFKEHFWLWIIVAVFMVTGSLLAIKWFNLQINPDATSYFSVAQKYAKGDFKDALNGYWGPLLSWLLIPFVWLNKNLIIGAKLINMLAGAIIIIATYFLSIKELKVHKKIAVLAVAVLAIIILGWNFPGVITPDILFVTALVLEIYSLILFTKKPTLTNCILLGVSGALLYFSKFFGGYFFIVQMGLIAIIQLIRTKKIYSLIPFIKVYAVFIILILPFVVAISLKYNTPTLSTAGPYNQGIIKIIEGKLQYAHPMGSGLFPPPNNSAYSVWEDPTYISVPSYHPLKYRNDFKRSLLIFWKNIQIIRDHILTMSIITLLGIFLLIAMFLNQKNKIKFNPINPYLIFVITTLVMIGGYSLVLVEQRYLWGLTLISLLSTIIFFSNQVKEIKVPLIFMALFMVLMAWVNIDAITKDKYIGKQGFQTANLISRSIPANKNVISDTFSSIYACYYSNLRCFGSINPSLNSEEQDKLYQDLKRNNIQYFIDLHTRDSDTALNQFKNKYFVVIKDMEGQPTILKLK